MKHAAWIAAFVSGLPALAFGGQPSTDFDWVTIGAPGNAAWPGKINGYEEPYYSNRGRVDYLYRIPRFEVSTAQWMEFVNNYSTKSNEWSNFAEPIFWGATWDNSYNGPGNRWILENKPNADRFPVAGITWREAAMFCNWLHNGKGDSVEAIENGAYDTSTFTKNPDGTFNDQLTHNPDAKYWIPTLDEWMKSAHYDPNRYGPSQEGWWDYPNSSDLPPVPGPPGEGETNAGFELPGHAEWDIPIGSYPDTQSPWGLLDTTGSEQEYVEEFLFPGQTKYRGIKGSYASSSPAQLEFFDFVQELDSTKPTTPLVGTGLRIVTTIPAPSALSYVALALGLVLSRNRR